MPSDQTKHQKVDERRRMVVHEKYVLSLADGRIQAWSQPSGIIR
jgi:hypothetical protein